MFEVSRRNLIVGAAGAYAAFGLDKPIAFDPHRENRRTGTFRLVDPNTRAVAGIGVLHFALRRAQNVHWQAIDVNKSARSSAKGQRPCVLWYKPWGWSGMPRAPIPLGLTRRG